MFKSFFASKHWAPWAYGGAAVLIGLIYLQVTVTIQVNDWYGGFYNLLQKPSPDKLPQFWAAIWKFSFIVAPAIFYYMVANYIARLYAFRWREAMTFYYLNRLEGTTDLIEGESQRIQEDTKRFATILESLGMQAVRAVMLVASFIPVMWGLGKGIDLPIIRDIPGALVWITLLISLGGIGISWFVGWFLPGLEFDNQVAEAALRKQLVRAEDNRELYADAPSLAGLFKDVKINYHRLFRHYGYFDAWMHTYDQYVMIVPYIAMGPSLFAGTILLGQLVQISNAFNKVHGSFAIVTHNWTTITEFRSIRKRLRVFDKKLDGHTV